MTPLKQTILLVDDDDSERRSLQLLLHWRGFEVRSYAAAAALLSDPRVDEAGFLIADDRLPDGNGFGVLKSLRDRGWAGQAILIKGHAGELSDEAAAQAGFSSVLAKPLRQHEMFAALGIRAVGARA